MPENPEKEVVAWSHGTEKWWWLKRVVCWFRDHRIESVGKISLCQRCGRWEIWDMADGGKEPTGA